jgi:hypothetical protein
MFFSISAVLRSERFSPWDKIKGTNIIIKPKMIKTKINKVAIVATIWLNFKRLLKKSKIGFPINVSMNDTTR